MPSAKARQEVKVDVTRMSPGPLRRRGRLARPAWLGCARAAASLARTRARSARRSHKKNARAIGEIAPRGCIGYLSCCLRVGYSGPIHPRNGHPVAIGSAKAHEFGRFRRRDRSARGLRSLVREGLGDSGEAIAE